MQFEDLSNIIQLYSWAGDEAKNYISPLNLHFETHQSGMHSFLNYLDINRLWTIDKNNFQDEMISRGYGNIVIFALRPSWFPPNADGLWTTMGVLSRGKEYRMVCFSVAEDAVLFKLSLS